MATEKLSEGIRGFARTSHAARARSRRLDAAKAA